MGRCPPVLPMCIELACTQARMPFSSETQTPMLDPDETMITDVSYRGLACMHSEHDADGSGTENKKAKLGDSTVLMKSFGLMHSRESGNRETMLKVGDLTKRTYSFGFMHFEKQELRKSEIPRGREGGREGRGGGGGQSARIWQSTCRQQILKQLYYMLVLINLSPRSW